MASLPDYSPYISDMSPGVTWVRSGSGNGGITYGGVTGGNTTTAPAAATPGARARAINPNAYYLDSGDIQEYLDQVAKTNAAMAQTNRQVQRGLAYSDLAYRQNRDAIDLQRMTGDRTFMTPYMQRGLANSGLAAYGNQMYRRQVDLAQQQLQADYLTARQKLLDQLSEQQYTELLSKGLLERGLVGTTGTNLLEYFK